MFTTSNDNELEWDKCNVKLTFEASENGIKRVIEREAAPMFLWELFDMFHDFANSMGYSGLDVQSLYETARMLEYQQLEEEYAQD